jgi:hypothetical protein
MTLRGFLVVAMILVAACGDDDECRPDDASYDLMPHFTMQGSEITNPFLPWQPGKTYTYQGGDETVTVTVESGYEIILSVESAIVHDTVTVAGQVTEDTYDWYAQDLDGNVWYMGESTKEYEDGVLVSTEGSWKTGVDGAKPGMAMPASPQPGEPMYQEFLPCVAEDMMQIVATNETVTVGGTTYTGCVKTHETTRLDPDVSEDKYYCSGVGLVLEVDNETGTRTELVSVTGP